ncbi:hypothetical protein [Prochlorococcus sp. MIT 1307]|uniref:hypothetical protein n=1 Tax=Prochlorococcus sp. MIT 1307 TaxID=3096219 RepID=UPI002A74FEA9|nr:hypothetical protein [Prochlorococcus sp. MIT 1307]
MARKRRKLNKEMELDISLATKKVELITAQINDIQEEETLSEYSLAFDPIKNTFLLLVGLYDTEGFTDKTKELLNQYKKLLVSFEEEYEI